MCQVISSSVITEAATQGIAQHVTDGSAAGAIFSAFVAFAICVAPASPEHLVFQWWIGHYIDQHNTAIPCACTPGLRLTGGSVCTHWGPLCNKWLLAWLHLLLIHATSCCCWLAYRMAPSLVAYQTPSRWRSSSPSFQRLSSITWEADLSAASCC